MNPKLIYDVGMHNGDDTAFDDLCRNSRPKYVSLEMINLTILELLRERGYSGFKWISQFNFLPVQTKASRERRRIETMQRLLYTKNPFVRALRMFGGKSWILERSRPSRSLGDWKFAMGSSGPFGEELPGRWNTFDEMREIFEQFQSRFLKREPSPFWTNEEHSFWTDIHATGER